MVKQIKTAVNKYITAVFYVRSRGNARMKFLCLTRLCVIQGHHSTDKVIVNL